MFQKTEQSEVSTNAEPRITSFFTPSAREMFFTKKTKSTPYSSQIATQLPNDLLAFSPNCINSLAWPSVFSFDNEVTVCVKNNYYEIVGLRGKNKYVNRHSECQAELVYFHAEKPTKKIHLVTIERYLYSSNLYLHLNISKYDPQTGDTEENDFHLACFQDDQRGGVDIWDFKAFEAIDNLRKAIVVVQVKGERQTSSHYKFILVDLLERKKGGKSEEKRMVTVLNRLDLDCQMHYGREGQSFLRTIKSQFGDIVLAITTNELYQLELEDLNDTYKLSLKPYKISKNLTSSNGQPEQIRDARFMSNGLKIMMLTNYGRLVVVEAHNFIAEQPLGQIMEGLSSKYELDCFDFRRIYPVNGVIAVQFDSKNHSNLLKSINNSQLQISTTVNTLKKGLVILKVQSGSFSLAKIINLYLDPKELNYIQLKQCEGVDELLVQYISKKSPEVLEVYKCRILMLELNMLARLDQYDYNYTKKVQVPLHTLTHYQPNEPQKIYHTAVAPLTSRIFYLLRDNELSFYKILPEKSSNREIAHLFNHTFFEKPIKITVNPLTLHFAVIFKEFVKFFYFCHSDIKNYYTLKLKNINEVRYIGRGQKMLICGSDSILYLLDSYTYREEVLMEFYGEVVEAHLVDYRHLFIRSAKNNLILFRYELKEENRGEFVKQYEVKLEEGDLYHLDNNKIVMFRRKALMEVYKHDPDSVPEQITEEEKQCYHELINTHPHLSRKVKCTSFVAGQLPTFLLLVEELGFILVATNQGNIKQYTYPLQLPTISNHPEVFTQQVSSHKLISLIMDARYSHLYAVVQNGAIIQLQISQYINGQLMPFTFVINQKTKEAEKHKRQFTDRNYYADHVTPIETGFLQANAQTIEELEFFLDKMKDDMEEMTKNMVTKGKLEQKGLKNQIKIMEKQFNNELKRDGTEYQQSLERAFKLLQNQEVQFSLKKEQENSQYQKELLLLYKENQRLNNILKMQDDKMTQEKASFVADFKQRLKELEQQKTIEVNELQKKYDELDEQRRKADLQHQIFNDEQDAQMEQYKIKIRQQQQDELAKAEDFKERMLGQNAKREKEISNLKHRSNHFQNLILETKVQITQLTKDQGQYERKKAYLQQQLKDKESIIERIERELVLYLKNTEDMKTIKNNHEFELEQYENQVSPISDNHQHLENNVKQMNQEIMSEYTNKVQKMDQIAMLSQKAEQLKQLKKQIIFKRIHRENQCIRLEERLVYLATHPFQGDVKSQLRELVDSDVAEDAVRISQQKEKYRREGEKLIRYKNMVRREIEEEQKREEHLVKNSHQFFKFQNENTTLTREFNELKKAQKYLIGQEVKILDKLNAVKSSLMQTPLRRVPSLHIKRSTEKKLTPFQRYEEEQTIMSRKPLDTSDTRLTRNSQSLSFLKGLMKQMNHVDSKGEKMEVMRQRVRTFVNPELKNKNRSQEFKKILFGRSRGISEGLKLK